MANVSTDAAAASQAWVDGLTNKSEKVRTRVRAVRVAPGQLAAAQADVWSANTMAAKDRFKRKVGAVPLTDWQEAMATIGVDRMTSGAQAKKGKMEAALAKLLPKVAAIVNGLPPRGNFAANVGRMTKFVTDMHNQAGS